MTSPAAARKRQQRATRPKHSRGEQARQLILEATLRVIARGGHRSITHRAVAAEAGINFSLVNYYFRGLDDLLLQAFEHVTERGRPAIESTWQEVWASLAPSQRGDLRRRDRRESLCRRLTDIAVRYVSHQSREYPEGLVLEMTALYDTNINPRLRELAHRYRADLAERFQTLCEQLGSRQPALDGQMLLGTLQRLEYESVSNPALIESGTLAEQLHRQFAWIINLPDR